MTLFLNPKEERSYGGEEIIKGINKQTVWRGRGGHVSSPAVKPQTGGGGKILGGDQPPDSALERIWGGNRENLWD